MQIREERKRHIVKTVTWQFTAAVTTFLIAWLVTGDLDVGLTVGGIGAIIKMFLYYFHERLWSRSRFGIVPARAKR
jgi:uncharacterized membrane protein